LGCYLIAAMVYASLKGLYFPIPFLGLFSFGFFYVGGLSLWQGVRRRRQMASALDVAAAD